MKKPLLINKLFYLTAFFLIIPNSIRELLFIIIFGFSFYYYRKENIKINYQHLFLLSIFLIVSIISLFYSEDLYSGIKEIEGFAPFLYLSFAFLVFSKVEFELIDIQKWYLYLNTANIIYLFIFVIYFVLSDMKINYNNIRNVFSLMPYISIHQTYLSMICVISIITNYYMENKKLAVFFFITNLFLLLLTGNRISFVFLVFLLIYFGYLLQIKRITKMILSCIFIIFMLFVFKINKVFYNKFAEIFNKDTYNITYINNSTSVRNAILDCSLDVIRKTDIVYGNGIGDVHQLLSNSYKKKHPELLKYYNSHNQFFSIYLSSGLIGIFSIIILYSYLFLISYNQKNRAMMITLFYFFCMSLFENILERRNGILLFLYTLLFIFNLFQKRETDYLKSIK